MWEFSRNDPLEKCANGQWKMIVVTGAAKAKIVHFIVVQYYSLARKDTYYMYWNSKSKFIMNKTNQILNILYTTE